MLVFAALALRLAERGGCSSLWTDEFATNWIASAPTPAECFHRAAATQGQYPLYFLLEWCVIHILPVGEFSLRLISLLASTLSAGLLYLLASKLLEKPELTALGGSAPESAESSGVQEQEENSECGAIKAKIGFFAFLMIEAPAILAGALFALNVNEVYYAQEARPYALATMCSILALHSFLRLVRGNAKIANFAVTAGFAALTCYIHYVFGVVLIIQNLWVFLNLRRLPRVFLKRWLSSQAVVALLCLPLLSHILSITGDSAKWTWLRTAGIADAAAIFTDLIDWRFTVCFAFFFCGALICEGGFAAFKRIPRDSRTRFAVLWLLSPPFAAYIATAVLKSSLLDARYMLLALPGLFVLIGCWSNAVRCPGRRIFLPIFAVCLYLMTTAAPCWRSEGRFAYRIQHDWRSALTVLSLQVRPGDAVLLRSGFIKENWLFDWNSELIGEYVQAPLRSFYFRSTDFTGVARPMLLLPPHSPTRHASNGTVSPRMNVTHDVPSGKSVKLGGRKLPIFNLTYSYDKRFFPYLDAVLANLAGADRIWILGVNPPNTNFPIERTPGLFKKRRKLFEKHFGEVYLSLLK